jgi:hypothetical protein
MYRSRPGSNVVQLDRILLPRNSEADETLYTVAILLQLSPEFVVCVLPERQSGATVGGVIKGCVTVTFTPLPREHLSATASKALW